MPDYECPKCKAEYDACGSHEDDAGEQTCDSCGFRFVVEIEYDPSYDTHCVEHEYGEYERRDTSRGPGDFRFCVHCGACEMRAAKEIERLREKPCVHDLAREFSQNTEPS